MDWISVSDLYSLKALYPFSYTIYLTCLIIKARLMKYFFYFFAKKSPFEYASYAHSFEILKHTLKVQTFILISYLSSTTLRQNFCVSPWEYVVLRSTAILQTAWEMTRTSQNQRQHIFDLLHLLPLGQNFFKQFPIPGPKELDLSWGLPAGDGQVKLNKHA